MRDPAKIILVLGVVAIFQPSLSWGQARVTGIVLDKDSLLPLSAEIAIAGRTGSSLFMRHAVASSNGIFTVDAVPAGEIHLTTKLEGYASEHFDLRLTDGETRQVTFYLMRGRRVSGKVLDPSGQPLSGALVTIAYRSDFLGPGQLKAVYQWETGEVRTGESGEFVIEGVHPERNFVLEVSHPEFLSAVSETLRAGVQDVTAVTVILSRGFKLSGRVTDTAGNPVPGARVSLIELSQPLASIAFSAFAVYRNTRGHSVTGQDGRFEFGPIASRQYNLKIRHPDFRPLSTTLDLAQQTRPVTITVTLEGRQGTGVESKQ